MTRRVVLALASAVVLLAGCTGDTGSREPAPRAPSPTSARTGPSTTQTALETPTVSESLSAREQAALDEEVRDAAWARNVARARELIRQGADVNAKDSFNDTGLIRAAERGHADVVGRLVQAEIQLDHVKNLGWTALLEAVILGDGGPDHQAIVRILLEAGADPSVPDNDGVTALEHAEAKGQDEVARIIRRVGS